jgi:hypothetical protein
MGMDREGCRYRSPRNIATAMQFHFKPKRNLAGVWKNGRVFPYVTLGRGILKLIAVTSLHIVTFGSSSERDAIWFSGTEIQRATYKTVSANLLFP